MGEALHAGAHHRREEIGGDAEWLTLQSFAEYFARPVVQKEGKVDVQQLLPFHVGTLGGVTNKRSGPGP